MARLQSQGENNSSKLVVSRRQIKQSGAAGRESKYGRIERVMRLKLLFLSTFRALVGTHLLYAHSQQR